MEQKNVDVLRLAPYPVRPLPPHAVEAAMRAIEENAEAPAQGLPVLRRSIAERVGVEIGRYIDPDTQVLVTNGAMQALNLVCRTLLDPGDEVLIPTPSYFFYGPVHLAGGDAAHVPTSEETGFAWDMETIAAAITPRTRAIVVNTPVNPTGRVLSLQELEAVGELALAHGLFIIADESYDRLVYDGLSHQSIAALPEVAARTILIKSCTKSYALPAWRVGYIVAPPWLTTWLTKALEWEMLHSAHVAQAVAAAVISGPQSWLEGVNQEFCAARDRLLAGLEHGKGITCVRPAGGPFLFLNIAALFASSEQASTEFLNAGVPTTPGHFCGSDAHVRLAFGAPPEVLDLVVERLNAVAERSR